MGVIRIVRAAIGVVLLLVLLLVVSRWWGEYKSESAAAARAAEASATAAAQGEGSSEGSGTASTGKTVLVLTNGLHFREKPSEDAKEIRTLKKGDKLTYIKKQGNWYQVQDSKKTKGWVSANSSYTKVQ